jgi:tricorn protease
MDGKSLVLRVRNRLRVLASSVQSKELPQAEEPSRESGWLDLDRLRVAVVPGDEWRQMFREAWRLQRDQFWTPDMSEIDWKGVHERYLPLVERVATRSEFSDLLWEVQGELNTSHAYELGGDYRPEPTRRCGAGASRGSRAGTRGRRRRARRSQRRE